VQDKNIRFLSDWRKNMADIVIEKEYFENGQVKEEIPVDENDLIQGVVRSFNEDGSLDTEVPFVDNVINGLVKWYQNGVLYATAEHKNGQKEGLLTIYQDGEVSEEVFYHNNLKDGTARYYNLPDKTLEYEVIFERGKAIRGKVFLPDGEEDELSSDELLTFED